MGNQQSIKVLDQIPNPVINVPELEFNPSSMGVPMLTTSSNYFGSFSFPEMNSAYSSVSTEIPGLSKVKIPSISAIQQKTKELRTSLGKDLQIGLNATLVDINGLVNDFGHINGQLYLQDFSAGTDLLNRYQLNLSIISERNKYIQKKSNVSSEKLTKIMILSFNNHNEWSQLTVQLQGIPNLIESLNQTKARLNNLVKKIEHTEAILTEDTLKALNIPFQKIKEEQSKQLDSLKYTHKLQVVNLANELEQKRQNQISQINVNRVNQIQQDGKKELLKLSQKKKQLENKFEQQKQDFEIYGTIRSDTQPKFTEVSKLEDVKIELNSDELDNFFSSKIGQNEEENDVNETIDNDPNTISYLDDEEPDWQ